MTIRPSLLLPLVLLAACGPGGIEARRDVTVDDGHAVVIGAVDKFNSAGRTPTAFSELATTLTRFSTGGPMSIAGEAELELVVLSLAPVHAVQAKSMADQIDLLALTVFPTLLAPPLEAGADTSQLSPKHGEDPSQYVQRLCAGPLASSCNRAVPELQGQIVYALAIQRATRRARDAVARCVMCASDLGWHAATLAWEELARGADEWIHDVERRAEPDNWPVAGAGSVGDPGLPEVELSPLVGYESSHRIEMLQKLCGAGDVIALHFHPDTTIAQARTALDDAHKAGCSHVAVIAREAVYPWPRRAYWVDDLRLSALRPTDSLQVFLHTVDAVRPPLVARTDAAATIHHSRLRRLR
jgi:hypothetical protein